MRNPETASIIERLIACRDTLKVVEGQFAVNLQPERAVMADAANALDAYDKTMQRIAEAPSPTPPAGDGWEPISEFVETAYDQQVLVGNADWDAPITVEAYQLRPESVAAWRGAPTHFHTPIPLPPPPVSKGEA